MRESEDLQVKSEHVLIFILDMFIRVMHRKTAVAGYPVMAVFYAIGRFNFKRVRVE